MKSAKSKSKSKSKSKERSNEVIDAQAVNLIEIEINRIGTDMKGIAVMLEKNEFLIADEDGNPVIDVDKFLNSKDDAKVVINEIVAVVHDLFTFFNGFKDVEERKKVFEKICESK